MIVSGWRCIDAAQHVCASEGWGPPDSNAGAMVVLARNGVLPAELGATMADGVRLRNVLVHLYAEVDDNRVVTNLDQLDHVERFVACLSVLVDDGDRVRFRRRERDRWREGVVSGVHKDGSIAMHDQDGRCIGTRPGRLRTRPCPSLPLGP